MSRYHTLQTLAGTATEQRTEQTASGTNRLQSHSDTENPALPSASNVSLLAERLGADNGRIARIIM
eukprot:gene43337-53806_t